MTSSAQGRSNRNRGANAERAVMHYLREQGWPDARRYLAGDGRQPGDIDWHPLVTLEVKDVKNTTWPTWCRQARGAAKPGMIPAVVRRTRGVVDVGAWECRIPFGYTGQASTIAWVDDLAWVKIAFADLVSFVRQVDEVKA